LYKVVREITVIIEMLLNCELVSMFNFLVDVYNEDHCDRKEKEKGKHSQRDDQILCGWIYLSRILGWIPEPQVGL
jgi:hypothetical protein